LKRNNISIDIICLGESGNKDKLQSLIAAAQSEDNCHFLALDAGINLLSDVLHGSPVLGENYGGGNMGVDMDMLDEDLQMALRISAEEAKQKNSIDDQVVVPVDPNEVKPDNADKKDDDKMITEGIIETNDADAVNNKNADMIDADLKAQETKLLNEAQGLT